MLVHPIQHIQQIDVAEANRALVAWDHKMGACRRPNAGIWAHGMFTHGELVAVTIGASLIRERTVADLTRDDAMELARLCAARSHLCRVMLRLWRELLFPAYGYAWAVNYQDEALHTGDTYRFDGWVRLGRSRSGTDVRGRRKGRSKTVWGWHPNQAERAARQSRPLPERVA